jgi:hypothetical protein
MPQKETLDKAAYTCLLVSFRRLSAQFQFSLSAVTLGYLSQWPSHTWKHGATYTSPSTTSPPLLSSLVVFCPSSSCPSVLRRPDSWGPCVFTCPGSRRPCVLSNPASWRCPCFTKSHVHVVLDTLSPPTFLMICYYGSRCVQLLQFHSQSRAEAK